MREATYNHTAYQLWPRPTAPAHPPKHRSKQLPPARGHAYKWTEQDSAAQAAPALSVDSAWIHDMIEKIAQEHAQHVLARKAPDHAAERPALPPLPLEERKQRRGHEKRASRTEGGLILQQALTLGGRTKPRRRQAGQRTIPIAEQKADGTLHISYRLTERALEAASTQCQQEFWLAMASTDYSPISKDSELVNIEDAGSATALRASWQSVLAALWMFAPQSCVDALLPQEIREAIPPAISRPSLALKGATMSNAPQFEPSWYAQTEEGREMFAQQVALALMEATQAGLTVAEAVAELKIRGTLLDGLTITADDKGRFRVQASEAWTQAALAPPATDERLGGLSPADLFSPDEEEDEEDELAYLLANERGR